ncbi:unnamed protein product [Darwinula stevensoni]|uniref:Major facilitator superfamily associated domain-containing protein n=1 Tax=Darwinula stevensoni TaxID=69355 RepID=A0A7R8XHF0_9CRUS|nr:unnamed protein product [Darwinula stevensoni]CAG0892492.1 unnamed protein product [Darwinula stevensoni]
MLHLSGVKGVSDQETTLANALPALLVILGPPVAGLAVDKGLGRPRGFLAASLVLTGIVTPLLLLVPPLGKHAPRPPRISLTCSAEGAAVVVERCAGRGCLDNKGGAILFEFLVHGCRFRCGENSTFWGYPHLCTVGSSGSDLCRVMNPDPALETPLRIRSPLSRYVKREDSCLYPLVLYYLNGEEYSGLKCRQLADDCSVECDVDGEMNATRRVGSRSLGSTAEPEADHLADNVLTEPICDSRPVFPWALWIYLFLRTFVELLPATAFALLNAAVLRSVGGTRIDREVVWGLASMAGFASLCGYLLDFHAEVFGVQDLAPSFYSLAVLMLLAAILTAALPRHCSKTGAEHGKRKSGCGTARDASFLGIGISAVLLGMSLGVFQMILPVDPIPILTDSPHLSNGILVACGVLPALPLMLLFTPLVKMAGEAHLIFAAFAIQSIRFAGYSYLESGSYWVMGLEALSSVSHYVAWWVLVVLTYKTFGHSYAATSQGILTALHFGLGRGLGVLLVGFGGSQWGARQTLRGGSAACAGFSFLFLCLYHLYLKIRGWWRQRRFHHRYQSQGDSIPSPR